MFAMNSNVNKKSMHRLRSRAKNEIERLFKEHGQKKYIGEGVSQSTHAFCAASNAHQYFRGKIQHNQNHIVTASLLHDVGQLVALDELSDVRKSTKWGFLHHEHIGAAYLQRIGFHVDVCQMVRNHVKAKRYLVSTSPFYYETLSEASKATLLEQIGMMNFSEQVEFENERLFHESILVRKFDDSAKPTEDAVMQTFNFLWKTYIQHCV